MTGKHTTAEYSTIYKNNKNQNHFGSFPGYKKNKNENKSRQTSRSVLVLFTQFTICGYETR